MRHSDFNIEAFSYRTMGVPNLTDHQFQPLIFEKVDEKEAEELRDRKPPIRKIPHNDVLVRYYGFRIGDVIKVGEATRCGLSVRHVLVVEKD